MTKDKALRLALEALVLWDGRRRLRVIAAIKEALDVPDTNFKNIAAQPAQPAQEPVIGTKTWFEDGKIVTQNLYHSDIYHSDIYTTPPAAQRTWVGLTDEDLEFWTGELGQGELGKGVIRAVSDHLKEKNT